LKTWLNVFVLSISFVLIIILQGILQGWSKQAIDDSIRWELADGQYWQQKFDPYDPFTLDSSAVGIPSALKKAFDSHLVEPVLITQGTIYPNGRMQGVFLKGIRPDQQLIEIPTSLLKSESAEIPVIVGAFMARQNKLKINDVLTLRWRDKNGTFEASDIRISGIFKTSVPAVDMGTIWLPLEKLQSMTLRDGCANIIIKSPDLQTTKVDGWEFKSVEKLTESVVLLVKTKSMGTSLMYFIFLLLAMLAIFDTQTLSIFRRQKEIGTMVAMGMTQKQVVRHFTLEGSLYALLAIIAGTIWGMPLFYWFSVHGISFGMDASNLGIPMADVMYTVISPKLVTGTILFIFVVTALVSYLPARKIAKMKPTDAIRGKIV
jgi:ABC-type lipoprotein release transport system permease subunit